MSGATAIKLMEQVWNRDLSQYDPDGPLPDVEPLIGTETIAPGRASVRMHKDPLGTARQWRELAEAKNLSIRQLMIEVSARQSFVGSAATIADQHGAVRQRSRSAMDSSSSRTSPPEASTTLPTTSFRSCRNAGCFAPTTRAQPCGSTSGCRLWARAGAAPWPPRRTRTTRE